MEADSGARPDHGRNGNGFDEDELPFIPEHPPSRVGVDLRLVGYRKRLGRLGELGTPRLDE